MTSALAIQRAIAAALSDEMLDLRQYSISVERSPAQLSTLEPSLQIASRGAAGQQFSATRRSEIDSDSVTSRPNSLV
jgi:hypothetical protein